MFLGFSVSLNLTHNQLKSLEVNPESAWLILIAVGFGEQLPCAGSGFKPFMCND